MNSADLIVVGAGPAGMAAASEAAAAGLTVAVLDEQTGPGGQTYRAVTQGGATRAALLGRDYPVGAMLARARQAGGGAIW